MVAGEFGNADLREVFPVRLHTGPLRNAKRDPASPAAIKRGDGLEPPPGELGWPPAGIARERETRAADAAPCQRECRTLLLAACGETRVSAEAPTGRTGPGVFRPKRNDERREASEPVAEPAFRRVREAWYFDRNATMSGAQRRSAGMDRRLNAARDWPASALTRVPSPVEPPPGELGRVGFATGC